MTVTEKNILKNGISLGNFKFTYPDFVVFVFNFQFLEIETNSTLITSADFEVKGQDENGIQLTRTIEVKIFKGKARVFYSKILQLFFYDVMHRRSIDVEVSLSYEGLQLFKTSHCVIWGGITLGERFNSFGTFKFDADKPMLERTRVWFRKYPFTVSLFNDNDKISSESDGSILARFDHKPYDENLKISYPAFSKIEESTNKTIVKNNEGVKIKSISFVEGARCFYAEDENGNLYQEWENDGDYFSSSYYNYNGTARTDMTWRNIEDTKLYRFNSSLNNLELIPYGRGAFYGMFELNPAITFPNAKRTATYKQKGPGNATTFSVFSKIFDSTFFKPSELTVITHLIINNNEGGYYLRWIDQNGCFQYYLFSKGKATTKNKLSSEVKEIVSSIGGNYFGYNRATNITSTITCKCCATCLKEKIYDYVATIIASPIIDLYMGKTKNGEEIWLPVNIVAANHDFNNDEILHDLEISFTKPSIESQSL